MPEDIDGLFALAPRIAQLGAALNSNWLHVRATAMAQVTLERPALQILGILQAHGEPLRVGQIAAEMRVEGPHVTRQVQRLERRGLVQRVVDPDDGRARLINLTPEGDEVSTRYRKVVMDWLSRAFSSWTKEEMDDLVRLGGRMVDDFLVFLEQAEAGERQSRNGSDGDGESGGGWDGEGDGAE